MAPDKTASATVPIDEDIQRFAIDLDERDLEWTLDYLQTMADVFEEIDEAGKSGVDYAKLDSDVDLPVAEMLELLADYHAEFDSASRPDTIRRSE